MEKVYKSAITGLVVVTLYLELCHQTDMYFSLGGEFFKEGLRIDFTGLENVNLFILLVIYSLIGMVLIFVEKRAIELGILCVFLFSILFFFPFFDFRGQDIVF